MHKSTESQPRITTNPEYPHESISLLDTNPRRNPAAPMASITDAVSDALTSLSSHVWRRRSVPRRMKKSSSADTSPNMLGFSSVDLRAAFFFSTLLPNVRQHNSLGWVVNPASKDLQQSERNITLDARLQLNLDIQVESQLQADGLRLGQARQDGAGLDAAGGGELLVVAAAAAAPGVDAGAHIGGRVVELPTQVSHDIIRGAGGIAAGTGAEWPGSGGRGRDCGTDLGHHGLGRHGFEVCGRRACWFDTQSCGGLVQRVRTGLVVARRWRRWLAGRLSLAGCADKTERLDLEAGAAAGIVRRRVDGVAFGLEREDTGERGAGGDSEGVGRRSGEVGTGVGREFAGRVGWIAFPRPADGKAGDTETERVEE